MRKVCILAVSLMALASGTVGAQSPTPLHPGASRLTSLGGEGNPFVDDPIASGDSDSGGCDCDGSGSGGCGRKGCRHGHGHGKRNADAWFNCNCDGSYKFPVPPLYTYHWPGLYSLRRMTDYQSPWRFPAIKPYEDETPVRDLTLRPEFRQASLSAGLEPTAEESISSKIARRYEQ